MIIVIKLLINLRADDDRDMLENIEIYSQDLCPIVSHWFNVSTFNFFSTRNGGVCY
jgi:hypothetical protein